jgi:hypothetical protein
MALTMSNDKHKEVKTRQNNIICLFRDSRYFGTITAKGNLACAKKVRQQLPLVLCFQTPNLHAASTISPLLNWLTQINDFCCS